MALVVSRLSCNIKSLCRLFSDVHEHRLQHEQKAKMENTRISVFKNILDCEQSVIFLCKVTACETQERERGG